MFILVCFFFDSLYEFTWVQGGWAGRASRPSGDVAGAGWGHGASGPGALRVRTKQDPSQGSGNAVLFGQASSLFCLCEMRAFCSVSSFPEI